VCLAAAIALAGLMLPAVAARADSGPRANGPATRPTVVVPAPEASLVGTAGAVAAPRGTTGRAARRPAAPPAEPELAAFTTNPGFRLNNRSALDLQEVYVSPANDRSWGRDRLGQDVLPAGRFMTIHLPDGQCVNDVRVVFSGGQVMERRRVNTCALSDLAFP
jgi:hypothetical protein